MRTLRIGAGAGYSGDRIDAAVELAAKGRLSYLVFECLAERTIALAQRARLLDEQSGYDPLLVDRMEAVLPLCAENGITIISNMGAANPIAAAKKTREVAGRLGLRGIRIAAVSGDDVLDEILAGEIPCTGGDWRPDIAQEKLVSANAYLGAECLLPALQSGANVILTGRVADPSMFVAPLIHEFGWALDDWELLGRGTAVGHLLECAGQVTGGYFADPGSAPVPGSARLGFPLAEVAEDGTAILSKVDGSGGAITRETCIEQLLYEVHDPSAYVTPDVVADFSAVQFEEVGASRVRVSGARGRHRTGTLKVSVGRQEGFTGEGQISYGGWGALRRAELAKEIVAERLREQPFLDIRYDLIGVNAIVGQLAQTDREPQEVRLRVAGRAETAKVAGVIPREVEALYTNGPGGGGGVSQSVRETIGIVSTLIPREEVVPVIHYEEC